MAAGPEKPVALITVFSAAAQQRVLDTIAAGPRPPIANWFVGTYGINKAMAAKVAAIPGCKFAPVFCIQPTTGRRARLSRRLSKQDAAIVGDAEHAGEIPGTSDGRVIPPRDRRVWGVELGRRFRDEMRAARAQGIQIQTWQFDEVLGECRGAGGSNPHREFIGGVLRGMAEGRPRLRDRPEKGFVWLAFTALKDLSSRPVAGDLQRFWEDLDAAALFLVGEEYPQFTGSPRTAAAQRSVGHTSLLRSTGTIRRRLGQRYILGMTPGWLPFAALGGVVGVSPPAAVNTWRNGFIDARIETGLPRGFAQFNFVKDNLRATRLEDAVRSLHRACERSRP
jgi:hypothetical protein